MHVLTVYDSIPLNESKIDILVLDLNRNNDFGPNSHKIAIDPVFRLDLRFKSSGNNELRSLLRKFLDTILKVTKMTFKSSLKIIIYNGIRHI